MARRKYEDHELAPEQTATVVCRTGRANSGAKLHKGTIRYRMLLDPKPWDPKYVITGQYAFCAGTQGFYGGGGNSINPVHPIHPDWMTREFDPKELTCKHCVTGQAEYEVRREALDACAKCGSPDDLRCQGCKYAPKLSV